MTAENGVAVVIASGLELFSDPSFVLESRARAIPFIQLNAVPADGVEPISIHKQSLRATRSEASSNNFKSIEDAVAVCVFQAPHGGSVAHQQASLAVKSYVVTSS